MSVAARCTVMGSVTTIASSARIPRQVVVNPRPAERALRTLLPDQYAIVCGPRKPQEVALTSPVHNASATLDGDEM
jgi:hypothetical protein